MDIRKWLTNSGGSKPGKPAVSKRKAVVVSDDDDDDAFAGKKKREKPSQVSSSAAASSTSLKCKKEVSRKKINYISSSESEDEVASQPAAKKRGSTSHYFDSGSSCKKPSLSSNKKEVTATDFFGDGKVKQTPSKKLSLATKKTPVTKIPETPPKDLPDCVDMEDPLDQADFTDVTASPRRSSRLGQSPVKDSVSHMKVRSSRKASRLGQSPKQSPVRPSSVASPTRASTTVEPSAKVDVCILKEPSVKRELLKVKHHSEAKAKPSTPSIKMSPSPSSSVSPARPATTTSLAKTTPSKSSKVKSESSADGSSAAAASADGEDVSPAPVKRASSFYQYKNREGPKNVGSRKLPEGAENCLGGLTFIITGVLEYAEREDAQELVTRHGGKLTQTVGKRTSYVVAGREPGPAKIEKADKFGIKQLTEDEFFDLIESLPAKAYDSTGGTPAKGKAAAKKAIVLGDSEDDIPAVTVKKEIPATTMRKHPSTSTGSKPPLGSFKSSSSTSSSASSGSSKAPITTGSLSSKLTRDSKSSPTTPSAPESVLWVDKYRPRNLKQLIGQQGDRSNMNKLMKWLKMWHHNLASYRDRPSRDTGAGFRAALLSGPPGIGKTTTATLVCKEAGFHFVELNASDTRSKSSLQTVVAQSVDNQTINGMLSASRDGTDGAKFNALLMDEVDGMAGNEDRGGMQELVALIKSTKMPIICMCNDRNSQKIRSLSNYCFDLRFQRPRVEQIRGAMLTVACREGISIKPPVLDVIINGANQDIRQVLHHLYLWTIRDHNITYDQAKDDAAKAEKHLKLSPFEVVRKVFARETGKLSLNEQLDNFFQDYSLMPLFVQEMYPKSRPIEGSTPLKALECMADAAESISQSDLVERAIRSSNNWGLLPLQGMLSTVVPGMVMRGSLGGMVEFPAWLGKRSKQTKSQRQLQEISLHSRLATSVSKVDMGLDMAPHLQRSIVQPLTTEASVGVPNSVEKMCAYSLLREDLEALGELTTFPPKEDAFTKLPVQTKSAFTRHFNKTSPNTTFSVASIVKKRKAKPAGESGDGEEGADAEEEEEQDIAALLQKKKMGRQPASSKASGGGRGAASKASSRPAAGKASANGRSKKR